MRSWCALSALGAVALGTLLVLLLTQQPNDFAVDQEPSRRLTEEGRTWEQLAETSAGPEKRESTPVVEPTLAAPCVVCLDEQAAVDVATEYLDSVGAHYVEVWVEVLEDFPWRGDTELVWTYQPEPPEPPREVPLFGRYAAPPPLGPSPIKYVGERMNGIPVPPAEGRPDLTWRVWYQNGWIGIETIEREVDNGFLPLEALAWPPQRYAKSFLVHARTGAIAATPIEGLVDTPTSWDERDRAAKAAATRLATRWLNQLENVRSRSKQFECGRGVAGVEPRPFQLRSDSYRIVDSNGEVRWNRSPEH